MLLVSERLKQVIEAHLQSGLEFLPAKILNHKRKPAGDTYFAVNFPSLTRCFNRDAH